MAMAMGEGGGERCGVDGDGLSGKWQSWGKRREEWDGIGGMDS